MPARIFRMCRPGRRQATRPYTIMGGCRRPSRTFTATISPMGMLRRVGQKTPPFPPEGWKPARNSRVFLTTSSGKLAAPEGADEVSSLCSLDIAFVLPTGMLRL